MEKEFNVDIKGMHCASCSSAVQRALEKTDGIIYVGVNLATNSATVVTSETFDENIIIKTIKDTGFEAAFSKESTPMLSSEHRFSKRMTIIAFICGMIVMYIGMAGHFNWPIPEIISLENPLNFALVQLIFTVVVIICGRNFFVSGAKALSKLRPNMDTLVMIGTGSAFIYSFVMTILIIQNPHYAHSLYFESAAVVIALVLIGKYLEESSKNRAKSAISNLAGLIPKDAIILVDGEERQVAAADVKKGDIVLVGIGKRSPVDGIIIKGQANVDESTLTGESLPVVKKEGTELSGGTLVLDGVLQIRATGVGQDTAIAQVVALVIAAQQKRANIARLADKVSLYFVPTVTSIAVIAAVIWALVGQDANFVINIFVSVLVVACPCALGLATPIAVMVGTGCAAQMGILFKGGDVVETASKIEAVLFDKTGTITKGNLQVVNVNSEEDSNKRLISLAATAEYGGTHPIAKAILEYADFMGEELIRPNSVKSVAGRGVIAYTDKGEIRVGTEEFMKEQGINTRGAKTSGTTLVYVALNDEYVGVMALADEIRQDTERTIRILRENKIVTAMITGDNEQVAEGIAKKAQIERFVAKVLPEGKANEVNRVKEEGKIVAFVGDGINDAPALATADVGISVFNGTDVAMDSSKIVLMKDDLEGVTKAIFLAKRIMKVIKQNLFWAFIYNIIGIPLAAGVWYAASGILLTPMFAGLAMALSSVCVVLNSLKLSRFKYKG